MTYYGETLDGGVDLLDGRLQRTEGGLRLTVQRKTVDVLLAQIPWNFTIVRLPWMTEPVYVSW